MIRCEDCTDGEIDTAECCEPLVAEHLEYLDGYVDEPRRMVRASEQVAEALADDDDEAFVYAFADLIRADHDRRACGGVIDGLLDDFGDATLRRLRGVRPW